MAEETQNISMQNFAPVKPPSIWQRLGLWFKLLTPKKKIFLFGGLILGAVLIAAAAYFVFAGDQSYFYFNDTSYNEVGDLNEEIPFGADSHDVDIKVIFDTNSTQVTLNGFDLFVKKTGAVGVVIESCQIKKTEYVQNCVITLAGELIEITSKPNISIVPNSNPITLATVRLKIISGTTEDFGLVFQDSTGRDGMVNLDWRLLADQSSAGLQPYKTYQADYTINTTQPSGDTVDGILLGAVSDTADEYGLDQEIIVQVVLNKLTADTVAFSANIKYDPDVLVLDDVAESTDAFPMTGDSKENNIDKQKGIYTMVRGRQGDTNVDCTGTPGENCNKDEVGLVAGILHFRTLNVRVGETPSIGKIQIETGAQAVADDGLGTATALNITGTNPLEYKIVDKPFNPEVYSSNGPDVYVKKVDGVWQAEVVWETNVATDGTVFYNEMSSWVVEEDSYDQNRIEVSTKKVKNHSITLNNLIDKATYKYVVISIDEKGKKYTSEEGTFVVTETENTFAIKNLSARGFYNNATVSWNTVGGLYDGLADSAVAYDIKTADCHDESAQDYTINKVVDNAQTLTHNIRLNNLKSNTTYCLKAISVDESKTEAVGYTEVTTGAGGAEFDANTVLKVERDRKCDKWLYCRSSMSVINAKGEAENLCFDLGVCDEKDSEGDCLLIDNYSDLGIGAAEQIFKQPENIDEIKNLSGLSKVGLEWPDGEVIGGDYAYGAMQPIGVDIQLSNATFSTGQSWPWAAVRNASLEVVNENDGQMKNLMLEISPSQPDGSGSKWFTVQTPVGYLTRKSNHVYAISFIAKSSGTETREVSVQLKLNNTYYTVAKVAIGSAPQTVVLTTDMRGSQFKTPEDTALNGPGFLSIGAEYDGEETFTDKIYIDNVSMKSVLPVSVQNKVTRTCRLYPTGAAVTCDFNDAGGKEYRGWKGFCVEEDPKIISSNPEERLCLNWWPVDIIPGETDIFGAEKQAGYNGRKPLYYCLSALDKYPYYNHSFAYKYSGAGDVIEKTISARELGFEGIYRDEILELKINNIVLSNVTKGGVPIGFCGVAKTYAEYDTSGFDYNKNPSTVTVIKDKEEEYGTIVFNNKNKDNWSLDLGNKKVCNGHPCIWFNPYAFVRCDDRESDDEYSDLGVLTARLVFDDTDMLTGIEWKFHDGDDEGQGWVAMGPISITFVGPRCEVVAQVVDPEGKNYAWASRIKSNGWMTNNYLGYSLNTDYAPYGGAVVGVPDSDPSQWPYALYVMPPDTSIGFEEPYQVRAGMPYGLETKNVIRYCESTNPTAPKKLCTTDATCTPYMLSSNPFDLTGRCISDEGETALSNIGKTQCVAGMAENLGNECNSSNDCGMSENGSGYGLCMGFKLGNAAKANIIGGYKTGKKNLENLFAKPIRVWQWTKTGTGQMGYVEVTGNTEYLWDLTNKADQINKKPVVKNIKIKTESGDEKEVIINSPQAVNLTFNTEVNADHFPLTAIRVDWGDKTAMSQVNNLKILPRKETTNPHVMIHTYQCINSTKLPSCNSSYAISNCERFELGTRYCQYKPSVQIQDNWDWCNNGSESNKCPEETGWTKFDGVIWVESQKQD